MERTYKVTILLVGKLPAKALGPALRRAMEDIAGVEVATMKVEPATQLDIDELERLQQQKGMPG